MTRHVLVTVALALLALTPAAAQHSRVYANAGWQFSLLDESSYTPGRPELTLGVITGEYRSGLELGVSWDYIEGQSYRRFLLDEEYGLDEPQFSDTRYHVLELSPRMVFSADESIAILLGLHMTQPLGRYAQDGEETWAFQQPSPLRLMGGLRAILWDFLVLDWRLYWLPQDGGFTWDRWDAVHNHGLTVAVDLEGLIVLFRDGR